MTLNTNEIVFSKDEGRVAGVDRFRIHSEWLDCPAFVEPMTGNRGFKWSATFRVTDGIEPIATASGFAETRKLAGASSVDWITRQIKRVITEREAYNKRAAEADRLSAAAGIWPDRWPHPDEVVRQLGTNAITDSTRLFPVDGDGDGAAAVGRSGPG